LRTIPPDYPTTGTSYTYDNAVNIVSDGLHADHFYNQNNRLIRVEIDGRTVAEYAYDAFERRVLKVVNGVTPHLPAFFLAGCYSWMEHFFGVAKENGVTDAEIGAAQAIAMGVSAGRIRAQFCQARQNMDYE
jgi:YD repeat-containing protein